MKKIFLIATFAFFVFTSNAQTKKAVFIIIDGVSKDVLEKLNTTHIKAIAQQGALINAYQGGERGKFNQTPTISAPGYNNVLTGVWFHKHNVPDNSIKAPNYHYPTIFRFFKMAYPEKKIGIFSSWLDNRTKLVGEGLQQTGAIQFDYKFDGLELDTVKFPHDKGSKYMSKIDETVATEAASVIEKNAPDLSWVYLQFTDDMGHAHGDSKLYDESILDADRYIGKIWDAVKVRQEKFKEDWLIVVTTDHGRDPKTGRHHGGQSDRERGSWIATNAKSINAYAKSGNASVVDILPTLSSHLNVSLSSDQKRELDGVALTGKVSITNPEVNLSDRKATLTWTSQNTNEKVKIWLSSSNNYKENGTPDLYKLVGEVPSKNGQFIIDLSRYPASAIYKIVIEGEHNSVNRWIVNNK
ncbi:MAG: alkaline phosphatase family protein [Flavobacteriales bacterium]|nr:MAG: alkaline phosphatase family protein [Flavobacteriales bacterium]